MGSYLVTIRKADGGDRHIKVMDEDEMFKFVNENRADGEQDNPWRFKVERIGPCVLFFNLDG